MKVIRARNTYCYGEGMPNTTTESRPRPVYLSTDCVCGDTYNWHIPGSVSRVPGCTCKDFTPADQA
jgi:hypothetical protein